MGSQGTGNSHLTTVAGPRMGNHDYLGGLTDDGLYTPAIKPHSLEKLNRHNYYAAMFTTFAEKSWPQRAYVGLCCGAGRARVDGTGEIVESAAMTALRLHFTHYVFVDKSKRCIDALKKRVAAAGTNASVTFIQDDVNTCIETVKAALPPAGRGKPGLLSLCFVDPYNAKLKFQSIRDLSRFWMDFLILLALGHDVTRNLDRYRAPESTLIADLIDCPTWREEFKAYDPTGRDINTFILAKYDEAMKRLKYQPAEPHPVKVTGMGVLLYYLVLYSKHPLAKKFWKATLAGTSPQMRLDV